MLPPVLEVYVVWHPGDDRKGAAAARQFIEHFHGTAFSGLIGGAIEVYVRSAAWREPGSSPRPLPFMESFPQGVANPTLTAVVPILGRQLAVTLEKSQGPWYDYIAEIATARRRSPDSVAVFPLTVDRGVLSRTRLGELLSGIQEFGRPAAGLTEPADQLQNRDLAQALAQFVAPPNERIQVFVSHTKHSSPGTSDRVTALIRRVRCLIGNTRLNEFFDAHDLQPGEDWAEKLIASAGRGALLALRTDLYSSREWCQKEMRVAKTHGIPVVILDALDGGEERGSFLMDHVPRVPGGADPQNEAVLKALNQLVDECLKRALWDRQKALAAGSGVAWWAPHAPEPVTLSAWLNGAVDTLPKTGAIRILHPDPPLGRDELDSLRDVVRLAGFAERLEIMTPRGLAARGG